MRALTESAALLCDHVTGRVGIYASQRWVTVEGDAVLVEPDPAGKAITGCSNIGPTIKPCTLSLPVQAGCSSFARISGVAICLDVVSGLTDGTPPGAVNYTVKKPGQSLVCFDS